MWDVYLKGKPQMISASFYDSEKKQWSLPYTINPGSQSEFNRTPKAVVDRDNVIWVAWSGRRGEIGPWDIYISRYEENEWSETELLYARNENSRAPAIFIDKSGEVWLAWHCGIGSEMKFKVLHYQKQG